MYKYISIALLILDMRLYTHTHTYTLEAFCAIESLNFHSCFNYKEIINVSQARNECDTRYSAKERT